MKKIHPEQFQGREIIRLSLLPLNQMLSFQKWLTKSDILSIENKNGALNHYAHYTDYEVWFDLHHCEGKYEDLSCF